MKDFPERLKESPHIHSSPDSYLHRINQAARALRLRMERSQGLGKGQVATYTGHLVLGRRVDGMIVEESSGSIVGVDPYPEEKI